MTPHRFQSGFHANRIARFERLRLGDDSIRWTSFQHGRERAFYIVRDGKDGPEYWVSHNDGFTPSAELSAALPSPPLARQYEGR